MEGAATVGGGGKGADKDGSDGVGTVYDVQGGGSDGDTLREHELGIDGGDSGGAGRFPP